MNTVCRPLIFGDLTTGTREERTLDSNALARWTRYFQDSDRLLGAAKYVDTVGHLGAAPNRARGGEAHRAHPVLFQVEMQHAVCGNI